MVILEARATTALSSKGNQRDTTQKSYIVIAKTRHTQEDVEALEVRSNNTLSSHPT